MTGVTIFFSYLVTAPEILECGMPEYITTNNAIYVVTADGKHHQFDIKGINWSGMETSHGVPYGLWDNRENGTTLVKSFPFIMLVRI